MLKKVKETKQNTIGETKRFFYRGISMHPTFKLGHTLYARPILRDLLPGDVIVYFDAEKQMNIVHRVVAMEGDLIYTRGDNNPKIDPKPILLNDVLGKVIWAGSAGESKPVRGGKLGLWHLKLQSLKNRLVYLLMRCFSPLYRWLKQTGVAAKIWHPKIRNLRVQTHAGVMIKYIHKARTIAVWQPQTGYFSCRRPYDLVIQSPVNQGLERTPTVEKKGQT